MPKSAPAITHDATHTKNGELKKQFDNDLRAWHDLKAAIATKTAEERELRKKLFAQAFPSPVEGAASNKLKIGDGYVLTGNYKINRTVDAGAVDALRKHEDEEVRKAVEDSIDWQPKLVLAKWKAFGSNMRGQLADMVTEKEGLPELTISQPKR